MPKQMNGAGIRKSRPRLSETAVVTYQMPPAAGTAAEGARLDIEPLPARIRCPDCGYEGPPEGSACPRCGGAAFRLTAGREFYVEAMEVE